MDRFSKGQGEHCAPFLNVNFLTECTQNVTPSEHGYALLANTPCFLHQFPKAQKKRKGVGGTSDFSRVFGRVTSIWRAFAWIYISVFVLPNRRVYLVASYQEL